ncbi:hypothetical protein ES703_107803 [subsurface metagenome]
MDTTTKAAINGEATVMLRSTTTKGTATVAATASGLAEGAIDVTILEPFPYQESLIDNEFIGGGVAQGWQDYPDDYGHFYALPFTFNFYGSYNSVYIHVNGYLDFETDSYDYESSSEKLKNKKIIAPLWYPLLTDGVSQPGEDIYIHQPSADSVCIRWCGENAVYGDPVNFEVILYENGNIKFNYGSGNTNLTMYSPTVGVSYGTGEHYLLSAHNGQSTLTNAQTSSIIFISDPVKLINTADPTSILADGLSTSLITSMVCSSGDTPVTTATNTITFSVTGEGTLLNTTTKAAINGEATVELQSTTTAGTATVRATADNLDEGTVDVIATPPGEPIRIINTAEPTSILADGSSTSLITSMICDSGDNTVTTATNMITFSVSGQGTLLDTTAKAAISGGATVALRSTTTKGTATVAATATNLDEGTVDVITVGVPVKLINTAEPITIYADGSTTSLITAGISDFEDELVLTATNTLTFSVSGQGTLLDTTTKAAINGESTVMLRSTTTPGTATVTATSSGLEEGTVDVMITEPFYYQEVLIDNEFIGGGVAQGWQGGDVPGYYYVLPFAFNFYETYTSVYVHTKGFLDFTSDALDWSNSTEKLKTRVMIAPLIAALVVVSNNVP